MTLTRAEILAMPADELRVEIAKRRGYSWWYATGIFYLVNGSNRMMIDRTAVSSADPSLDDDQTSVRCPKYTTSISDAWELVEEMRLAHIYVGVEVNVDGWLVDAIKNIESRESSLIVVGQPTAPLAISRAWLLWDVTREGAG